jgi:outer membrane protein assembly factor BamD (BamD/ComL family)
MGIAVLTLAALVGSVAGCAKGEKTKKADELFAGAQQLQQEEKYTEAIKVYRQIAEQFPKSRQGANSQFMIGYIYANHVKDLEQARLDLNRFLTGFAGVADSGLIAGAHFELQFLGKDISDIPTLSALGLPDTTAASPPDTGVAQ